MLRVATPRFPSNPVVKNECGIPWGAVIVPLAATENQKFGEGTHRRKYSGSDMTSATPWWLDDSDYRVSSPGTRRLKTLQTEEKCKATTSGVARCDACGAYISKVARMVTKFWRCPLCGRRNVLSARYTERKNALDRYALVELSTSLYELEVDDDEDDTGTGRLNAGYAFVVDLSGTNEEVESVKAALLSAVEMLGEGDSVALFVMGTDTIALLDTARTQPELLPLFRRVRVTKDGALSVPWASIFHVESWLMPLRNSGKQLLIRAVASLSRSTVIRSKQHAPEPHHEPTEPPLVPTLNSILDLCEAAKPKTVVLRCIAVLCSAATTTKDHPSRVIVGAQTTSLIMDIFVLDDVARRGADGGLLGRGPTMQVLAPLVRPLGGSVWFCENLLTLREKICLALERPVVLRGVMRIRTTSQFRISRIYGAGVRADSEVGRTSTSSVGPTGTKMHPLLPDGTGEAPRPASCELTSTRLCASQVDDMFHVNVQGRSDTISCDFEFTAGDGFLGADLLPCVQVAFRCVVLEPSWPTKHVLRVETVQLAPEKNPFIVRREADPLTVFTMLHHKALEVAGFSSAFTAKQLMRDWLVQCLAKASKKESLLGSAAPLHPSSAFQDIISRLVFGFSLSSAVGDGVSAYLWERLPPEWLSIIVYPRLIAGGSSTKDRGADRSTWKELRLNWTDVVESGCEIFILDTFKSVVLFLYTPHLEPGVQTSFPPPEDSLPMKTVRNIRRQRPIPSEFLALRSDVSEDFSLFQSMLIEDSPASRDNTVVHIPEDDEIDSDLDAARTGPESAYDNFMRTAFEAASV